MTSPQLRNLSWVDLVLGPIISHSYPSQASLWSNTLKLLPYLRLAIVLHDYISLQAVPSASAYFSGEGSRLLNSQGGWEPVLG